MEVRPKAAMRKEKTTKKNDSPSASSSSPKEAPEVEGRLKFSTKKIKKNSLSSLGATSLKATNVSKEDKVDRSSRLRARNAGKDKEQSRPTVQRSVPKRLTKEQRLQQGWEVANQFRQANALPLEQPTNLTMASHPSNSVFPAEVDRNSVHLVTNSRNVNKISLHRDPAMQTSIVGLYRRRVGPAGQMSQTATCTPIYTRDPEAAVHQHGVELKERGSKQVYLVNWYQTTPDGKQELHRGFVPVEDMDQHIDYLPGIESFEHESRAALYKEKDLAAARKERKVVEEKGLEAVKKV